jgi:hypothetical protein
LIAFPEAFPAVFPFALLGVFAFAGMTKGGRSVGRFESQDRERIYTLHAHLKIEPFNDFLKRFFP